MIPMRFSTLREEKIEQTYKQLNIAHVFDLSIENISILFNIKVHYYHLRSQCVYDDHCGLMYLNENQSFEKIRYDFFHELGHFFEHCNDQRITNTDFVRMQERQAHLFALYASMPRYLFEPLMQQASSLIELREAFQLPETLIKERVRIIQQQNATQAHYLRINQEEDSRIKRTLQSGNVYGSTITVLKQLKSQVGEENLSYDIKSLLR